MNLEQIDTSTTAGKARVMQLAAEGRRVAKKAFNDRHWFECDEPAWNWPEVDYAIIAALTPPEGFVLVPVEVERDAARYRHLRVGYLDCWEDAHTEEPSHASFNFECRGWDIDAAIDASIASARPEVTE